MGNGDLQISNEILVYIKRFTSFVNSYLHYSCHRSFKASRPIVDVQIDGEGFPSYVCFILFSIMIS